MNELEIVNEGPKTLHVQFLSDQDGSSSINWYPAKSMDRSEITGESVGKMQGRKRISMHSN